MPDGHSISLTLGDRWFWEYRWFWECLCGEVGHEGEWDRQGAPPSAYAHIEAVGQRLMKEKLLDVRKRLKTIVVALEEEQE